MVLESLRRLNVDPKRIEEIKNTYINSRHLDDAESTDIGRLFLEKREEHHNTKLTEYLKGKEYTIPSGLFHHFIRLYFSLGNKEEELSALAYFDIQASEHKFQFEETDDIYASLELLKQKRLATPLSYPHPSTMEKFKVILDSDLKYFIRQKSNIDIKELLDLFLRMFEQTRSFYVLHVLTGFQAIVGLEEYIDLEKYIKEFYKYAQIFYVFGYEFDNTFKDSISIEEGVRRVGELVDAHDIKLMYSLNELWKIDENPLIEKIVAYILKG
jgi:hypothetical protein